MCVERQSEVDPMIKAGAVNVPTAGDSPELRQVAGPRVHILTAICLGHPRVGGRADPAGRLGGAVALVQGGGEFTGGLAHVAGEVIGLVGPVLERGLKDGGADLREQLRPEIRSRLVAAARR
ncbi:hypothetical protein [Amycolatopsis alkalitolerans]|uniref:Uncharacterized protein n=1 Tax=Amycolatopsis alkalitolerans TaxID=2547244 RepID=A0A5C4LTK4_9PSEU|nr:hypothetical protein [Amycolatopsis alkalitolerans]TNC21185.1 hypothetical protein FG385_29030 [Amycolatopsis alkalitolerans]